MQARRRVEPTGTNRPIGLIALVIRVRTGSAAARRARPETHATTKTRSDDAACLPNTTLAVAAPCAAESQKNCDAPVWWPERRAQNPIPSRTRPLNTPAPMVLCLKTRESRSPPDPPIANTIPSTRHRSGPGRQRHRPSRQAPRTRRNTLGAGWSSPVARQAHNLKVTGSNPVPATKHTNPPRPKARRVFSFGAVDQPFRSSCGCTPRRSPLSGRGGEAGHLTAGSDPLLWSPSRKASPRVDSPGFERGL